MCRPRTYYYVALFFCVAVQRKRSFVEGVVIEKTSSFYYFDEEGYAGIYN